MRTKRHRDVDARKIKTALAYVHHWEKHGQTRAQATRDVIRGHALSSDEAAILMNALHVKPSEIASKRDPGSAHKAWEVWSLGNDYDEPVFIAAYSDKGQAKAKIERLKVGRHGHRYLLKNRRVSARQTFGTRGRRRYHAATAKRG